MSIAGYEPIGGGAVNGVVRPPAQVAHRAVTAGGQPTKQATPYTIGQANFADINAVVEMAQQNPALAAQIINMAKGQKGRTTSTIGKYMDNLYGRALQAALSTAGMGGETGLGSPILGILEGSIGSMMGNGAGFVPYMAGRAQQTLGQDMGSWDDDTVRTALAAANALQSLGLGDIAAGGMDSELDDLLYDLNTHVFTDPSAKEGGRLAQLLRGSGYERAMQRFAATR